MNPEQKIKHLILLKQQAWGPEFLAGVEITNDNVDTLFDENNQDWELQDAKNDVRCGEVGTSIPSPYSRHYEAKSVAAQYVDGSWVGWTYWYGGGKHGEPESIDWMDVAYNLTCVEETKTVVVREFTKETE